MFRRFLLIAAAPMALVSCTTGGMTGAAPVSAGEAAPISAKERQQGEQADPDIRAEFGGEYNGSQADYATRVGQRIAVQSGLSAEPDAFDVTLLNSPVNNAFAIPGGYVYVTRQLMALMNDEAELAAVLGHEVGHVAARHSKKRQSTAQRNAILNVLGQVLISQVAGGSQIGQILSQGVGTGTQLLTLGYSRSQETQSDDLAIEYLVDAGYDPKALSSMLASLAAQNRLDQQISGNTRSIPEWSSTHPDPDKRVARALTRATETSAVGERNRAAFLAAIDGMMYGDDPKQGVIEGRNFLHPDLRIAFTIPQGFAMQNGTSAVSIQGSNAKAQFGTAAYNGNLETYVGNVLKSLAGDGSSLPASTIRRTTVNGIPTAYTQLTVNNGQSNVDLTVYAYATASNKAFHFITLTPAGQGLGAMDSMVASFRSLSSSEAAAIKPKFVRVVTIKAGDSMSSLSGSMAFEDHQLERFMVLNALSSDTVLRTGDKVKIITY
ncbi:MAG: M48 family metalloprotease [Blastomonas sp.]